MPETGIYHKGHTYSSTGEIPGIRNVKSPAGLTSLSLQKEPIRPEIVKTRFDGLEFFSYKGANLPPSRETYELAQKTAEIILATEGTDVHPLTIIEIGTGSGIIPITIESEIKASGRSPKRVCVATDISGVALEVAELNARINSIDTICFRQRDLFEGIVAEFGKADVVIWNPPYYYSNHFPNRVSLSDFIPPVSLDGGVDSLYYYRQLFSSVHEVLTDRGIVIVQTPSRKEESVINIATTSMRNIEVGKIMSSKGNVIGIIAGDAATVNSL